MISEQILGQYKVNKGRENYVYNYSRKNQI
ncbi:hypothetical protein SAMN05428981_1011227 [Bacillus sp. OV194]|nr:hypothetical protein SAMN05428981_1011227 [Bacillus sp. OV194]